MAKENEHRLKTPDGFYEDREGILRPVISLGLTIRNGRLEKVLPEGSYLDKDGHVAPIPTEPMLRRQELEAMVRNEKAAQLQGHRPSDQELRDRAARRHAARMKDEQDRER